MDITDVLTPVFQYIKGEIGKLPDLVTIDKTSLVDAINEIATGVGAVTLTGDVTGTGFGTVNTTLGVVPISKGGTGQTTANAAFNALAPSQISNSGKVLSTDGTNTSWITVSGSGPGSLSSLSDVVITSLVSNQILQYNGTSWINWTPNYITGNQLITLSGDILGSGTTAITTTLPNINSNIGTFNNLTVNAKGQVTAASNTVYLTDNQMITLSGDTVGSGTTSITTTTNQASTTFSLLSHTDSTVSTNQDNFNPTGLSNSSVLNINATSDINITGLQGGSNGRILILKNIGTGIVTLTDLDINSSSINQFQFN